MVRASSTMARPPTAANAASFAVSIRLGLPPAVMYIKPAQARNSPAAASPILVAAVVSLSNRLLISVVLATLAPFNPTARYKVRAPEAGEHRLNRDHLSFGRCIDLLAVADVDT